MWLELSLIAASLATSSALPSERFNLLDKRQTIQPFTGPIQGPLAYSPPAYPSPWGSGAGNWSSSYEKARAFVSSLTLLEKVNLTTGVGWEGGPCVGNTGSIPRIGFPGLCLQDSPLGVRDTDYNTGFPAGVNVAATWDRSLAYARGVAMGEEHRGKGVDSQLGPVVGPLGRAPEGGRNWEGFAPDPYLSGILVASTVQGMQSAGIIACTKHLVGNEQEHFRQESEADSSYGYNITSAYSSNIDDKTMHELYLWPFADAVRAGTGSIMCSYNNLNNSYACQNSYLLNHLLKDELDFQGFVMSDWGAQHSGIESALAGLDMTMPGDTAFDSGYSFWGTNLTIAVLNGTVPEWKVDDMVTRIMAAYYYVGRDTAAVPVNFYAWSLNTYDKCIALDPNSTTCLVNQHVDVRDEHAAVVRAVGQASSVLLKNEGGLPLTGKERQLGIFGYDAFPNPWGANGCSDRGCDNGTLAMGWGSGTANFPYLVTPYEAIQEYVLTQTNTEVFAISDNYAYSQIDALASQTDVAIVFVNADSGEGYIDVDTNAGDRNNLTLWIGGDALIQNVTSKCNNTIVVMHTVGAVNVSAWYDNDNVTAILWLGLPGQESGNSLVDVLFGAVNPGGKLPFTIGRDRTDYTTDLLYEPNNGQFGAPQIDFTEGLLIDYRGFDAQDITPIYEFGFGLSYTTFSFSNLVVTDAGAGQYMPGSGMTSAAPSLGNYSTNPADYQYPSNFPRIPIFVYPYLNGTSLQQASEDPFYGESASSYLPAGFADGSPQPILAAGGAPGGNPGLYDVVATVTARITNTGTVDGDEVPQLYVNLNSPGEPPKVLRGFDRMTIPAGQSATFTTELLRRDLSVWDVVSQNWIQQCGVTIYVGSSSRNLPLSATFSSTSCATGGGSGGSGSSSMGGASASASGGAASSGAPVSQISDGQPQATTGMPVTQISDGQPQGPTGPKTTAIAATLSSTGAPVSQISDGQPQASTGAKTTGAPVSQISDGQPQASTGAKTTGAPVSQISDGQPQASTGAPISQISDGQPQASTGAPVSQKTDGQPQATTA